MALRKFSTTPVSYGTGTWAVGNASLHRICPTSSKKPTLNRPRRSRGSPKRPCSLWRRQNPILRSKSRGSGGGGTDVEYRLAAGDTVHITAKIATTACVRLISAFRQRNGPQSFFKPPGPICQSVNQSLEKLFLRFLDKQANITQVMRRDSEPKRSHYTITA